MAPRVVVLVNGRLVAEGDTHAIRELLRDRPRTVHVVSDGSERLAQALIGEHLAGAIRLEDGEPRDRDRRRRRARPAHRRAGGRGGHRARPRRADRRRPRERVRLPDRARAGAGTLNGLIYRLTLRMLLRGKRPVGLAVLPLLAVLLAIARSRAQHRPRRRRRATPRSPRRCSCRPRSRSCRSCSAPRASATSATTARSCTSPRRRSRAHASSSPSSPPQRRPCSCCAARRSPPASRSASAATTTVRAVIWSALALILCGVAYSALFLAARAGQRPAGADRADLHRALGGVGRDVRAAGELALGRRIRPRR